MHEVVGQVEATHPCATPALRRCPPYLLTFKALFPLLGVVITRGAQQAGTLRDRERRSEPWRPHPFPP